MNRLLPLAALLLLGSVLGSCGDSGPVAGDIALRYESPVGDDQAIRFTVTASAPLTLDDLTATCSGCQAFVRKMSDGEIRAIIHGPLATGNVALVSVSDVGSLSGYSVALQEVAAGDLTLPSPATRKLLKASAR
ncbi:MAG: hypothetical protein JSW51_14880 [Gemmatimonadota bacterium]|nr:MAG: hypothetical protein JSW51_14880 [Gemmatimonadota bacterium]